MYVFLRICDCWLFILIIYIYFIYFISDPRRTPLLWSTNNNIDKYVSRIVSYTYVRNNNPEEFLLEQYILLEYIDMYLY